ncbi:MAG TPA: methyltransferase domain-containing protein [Gemmatimonadaceae bacterium]|nr:methyltransferase domain-containing protein [Gemmatimonadaceae bacterium]
MTSAAAEERYLAKLESARADWWSSGNFDTWKRLYAGEYPRGFLIIDTLCKYAPEFHVEGASVLDVGCGDAGALIAFAEQGAKCAGIECFDTSLERGRLRAADHGVEVDLKKGVAESIPYPDATFDLVMLDNVLEHVTDRPLTLREVKRVLKPGGLLYMVTPKPFSLYSLWNDPHYDLAGLVLMPRSMQIWYFEKIRGGGKGTYDVGVIPTRRKIRQLLDEAGFKITVSPRELWINYLRDRVSRPEEVRAGIKRKMSEYITRRSWPFENRFMRWFWDVSVGSNFIIAKAP